MKLALWIAASDMTDADFARLVGISRQSLSRYKSHSRFPRTEILKRISAATKGMVTANDFAGETEERSSGTAA